MVIVGWAKYTPRVKFQREAAQGKRQKFWRSPHIISPQNLRAHVFRPPHSHRRQN